MAARKDTPENFLQRWSRRKSSHEIPEGVEPAPAEQKSGTDMAPDEQPQASATPAEEKPIWQRQDADPAERRQALRDLFQQSKFNQTDGLEEYENDYNYRNFAKLGAIVTHEMRRYIERQAAQSDDVKDQSASDDKANNDSERPDNDEDNRLG